MGYPTAYRTSAARSNRAGIQGSVFDVQRAADRNRAKRRSARRGVSRRPAAYRGLRRTTGRALGYGALGRNPYFRFGMLAWRLYQYRAFVPEQLNLNGFTQEVSCGSHQTMAAVAWPAVNCGSVATVLKDNWESNLNKTQPGQLGRDYAYIYEDVAFNPSAPPRYTARRSAIYWAEGSAELQPYRPRRPAHWPEPAFHPAIDPMALPIGAPVPVVKPLPVRAVPKRRSNPYRSPTEQPRWGPGPAPRSPANTLPGYGKTFVIEAGKPVRELPAARHKLARPSGKQRKFVLALPKGAGYVRFLDFVGETADLIGAIYDALPRQYRPRRVVRAAEQLEILYEHWDKLDLQKAAQNILVEHAEDYMYGRIGRSYAAANRASPLQSMAGWQFGPAL